MGCIAFWKSKKNFHPITMLPSSEADPPDKQQKKKINQRKKNKKNENNK